jgi:hypothetical protein
MLTGSQSPPMSDVVFRRPRSRTPSARDDAIAACSADARDVDRHVERSKATDQRTPG